MHIHTYMYAHIYTRCIFTYIHKILYIYTYKYIHTHWPTFYIVSCLNSSVPPHLLRENIQVPEQEPAPGLPPLHFFLPSHPFPLLHSSFGPSFEMKLPYSGFSFSRFHSQAQCYHRDKVAQRTCLAFSSFSKPELGAKRRVCCEWWGQDPSQFPSLHLELALSINFI